MASYENSHGVVEYSRGNIVSGVVITRYGFKQVLNLLGDHFLRYVSDYFLCCTPETNTILYVNCN